jgi:hypothetical protein
MGRIYTQRQWKATETRVVASNGERGLELINYARNYEADALMIQRLTSGDEEGGWSSGCKAFDNE